MYETRNEYMWRKISNIFEVKVTKILFARLDVFFSNQVNLIEFVFNFTVSCLHASVNYKSSFGAIKTNANS